MTGILGKKIGMTRLIEENGKVTPVTVVECQPNEITQVKTIEKDGYSALVLGFEKLKKPTKTRKFKKVKEFKIDQKDQDNYKIGDTVTLEALQEIEKVKITSISKGKGFQGVIKRHNFSRGPETHGSHHHREPGSIGACTKPGRVAKGKKMPGRMGGVIVTTEKVKIAKIDLDKNLICIKGPVSGPNGGTVTIRTY